MNGLINYKPNGTALFNPYPAMTKGGAGYIEASAPLMVMQEFGTQTWLGKLEPGNLMSRLLWEDTIS